MSPWNYTNHYCATVIIILRLNLPALYAETIELIPTRKWQHVMWGENGFRHVVVLQETLRQCCQYYKAPSELVLVQNVQCMNKGLLICSRLPTTLLRTCLTACTRASWKRWYFVLIYFDELQSYLKRDFFLKTLWESSVLFQQWMIMKIRTFERFYDAWIHSNMAQGEQFLLQCASI